MMNLLRMSQYSPACLVVGLCLSGPAFTTGETLAAGQTSQELDEALQQIVDTQSGISSMTTTFRQSKRLSLFDETFESSGTIVIEKPDFYCWLYSEPEQSVFYLDDKRSGTWDPVSGTRDEVALGQRKGLASIIKSLTSMITGNLTESYRSDFEVRRNASTDGSLTYTFRPQADSFQTSFKKVTIHFDPHTKLARNLELLEQNGDVTTMAFDPWQLNMPVDRNKLIN